MIVLPPGFDYTALFSDYFYISVPFIGVAFLFTVFAVIKKLARLIP